MQIQPIHAYTAFSPSPAPARPAPASPAAPATSADRVSISPAARELHAAEFDTDQGRMGLDIDAYFTPPGPQGVNLDTLPLLLPSRQNIDALAAHISAAFPGFLAENGIPSAPASIAYDNTGQIQLPADYAYAAQFKQALADHPTMARELQTVNALTSTLVEINKSIPFQQEYAAATSQAAADAVVAKYSYLFSANRHYDSIALNFAADGTLSLTHDGKPLSAA